MTDEELGAAINAEIKKYYHGALMLTDEACGLMGKAARALLAADRPVATREAVAHKMAELIGIESRYLTEKSIDDAMALLSHFAPPRQRMMLDGMDAPRLADIICDRAGPRNERGHLDFERAAVEVLRLAMTPAPEVDPDAAAKRWHRVAFDAANKDNFNPKPWDMLQEPAKDAWRAIAAEVAAADAARAVGDEEVAKVLNDEMEGPIANQDFLRQKRQWEMCLRLASALRAAGLKVVRG